MKVTESLYTTQDFATHAEEALAAAQNGPVVIGDGNAPTSLYVLMSVDHYMALKAKSPNVAEALYMPGAESIDLESYLPAREESPVSATIK